MEDSLNEKTVEKDAELDKCVRMFESSDQQCEEARILSERDRDYYDHKQLTKQEIAALKRRKQPPVQVNRIKPKVDFLLGMERQMRTNPKAYPRTPQHEQAADACTDAVRFVCDNNDWDYLRSAGFFNLIVEGVEGAEICVDPKKNTIDVKHHQWDRVFYDPHSRALDFSDAKWKGVVVWMDADDAKALGNPEAVDGAITYSSESESYDDKPTQWVDKSRNRVRVVSIAYKKADVWHTAMFTSGGFIEEPKPSAYVDEEGEPLCPYEFQSCFVDREGNRYGLVRPWIDVQDEINKRRSKALHLSMMRQTLGEKGAVADVGDMKRQLARPDGHVEVTPGMRFEILPTTDMAQFNLTLLQEAKGEIDAVGANSALQGTEERVMSGRALMARQQSGQTELGPVFDSHRHWQKRIYRQIWYRIRQYWTSEKWVRVTDNEENLKWVGLNRPVTLGEQLQQQFGGLPPEYANDPRLNIPVGVDNNVAEIMVDIVLEDAPDSITIQQEQFELLVQAYQANPQKIPFEVIIRAMPGLRNKDELLEMLQGDPQQAQKQAQIQDQAVALEFEGKSAEVEKDKAKAFKDTTDALLNQVRLQTGVI